MFNYVLDFFMGTRPPSHFGCALSRLGQSLARVKFSGRSTPYGLKYSLPKKCVIVGPNSLAVSGPKLTGLFSLNAGGIAIVCNVGRFWISSAVPEIFAIKV